MVKEISIVCSHFTGCIVFIKSLLDNPNTKRLEVTIEKQFYELHMEMVYRVVGKQYLNKKEV